MKPPFPSLDDLAAESGYIVKKSGRAPSDDLHNETVLDAIERDIEKLRTRLASLRRTK